MGVYLSKPVTDKFSTDEASEKLRCGTSTMQGWRESQEDAHNCIINFDENTSYFAVYDGHGGREISQYCSLELPNYLKNTEAYKAGDMEKALIDAFLGLDASLITQPVNEKLKELRGSDQSDDELDEEENVQNLYEEATMPIEQVIEKYASNNPKHSSPEKKEEKPIDSAGACCSSSLPKKHSKDSQNDIVSSSSNSVAEATSSSLEKKDSELKHEENGKVAVQNSADSTKDVTSNDGVTKENCTQVNGEVTKDTNSSSSPENGVVSKKGKGKATAKAKGAEPVRTSARQKANADQLYKQWLDLSEDSSDDSDEEDDTFQGPNVVESSDDDDDESGLNESLEDENSEDSLDDEEEDDEEEEEEVDEHDFTDDLTEEERQMRAFFVGSTAVVALLRGDQLYVANAGDSRCIISRNGKAIEMSLDHKPEDKPEQERIEKAGGYVDNVGRVNGFNLSRALGDHGSKRNKDLPDREQIITALPDVRTCTINASEDEFMVLACDGIWNSMSSQEVVDFVRKRLEKGVDKLSRICEEMFDNCLLSSSPYLGDGSGCDNMTAIIVQFKQNLLKRPLSSDEDGIEPSSKQPKTDDNAASVEAS